MCLAIFAPAGVEVPTPSIRNGWVRNSDGGGFAYIKKGKVHIVKGLMSLSEFAKAYDEAFKKYGSKSPFLLHFRIRSMGTKDETNTHPFSLKNGALIHNGTLDGTGAAYGHGRSDTAIFVERYQDFLTEENMLANKDAIGKAVGYNKFAALFATGNHVIINEDKGQWKDKVWYSNSTYQDYGHSSYRGQRWDPQKGQYVDDTSAVIYGD